MLKASEELSADLLNCLYKVSFCVLWIAFFVLFFCINPHKYFAWKCFIQLLLFFFHPVILRVSYMLSRVLYADFVAILRQSFSSSRSSEVLRGHKWVHRSLQFCDISILIRTRSQHTLCVEWLNGKNLKPLVLVRMRRDRPWEEAGLGCLHLFVTLMSYQRYSSLPKGYFSLSPIPVGLVKMCAVYPGQKSGLRGPKP